MMTTSSDMVASTSSLAQMPSSAEKKANGIHYTPPTLARYLAGQLVAEYLAVHPDPRELTILDPACGDGELLLSLIECLPKSLHGRIRIIGFDTSAIAIAEANERLADCGALSVALYAEDFLSAVADVGGCADQMGLAFTITPSETRPRIHEVDLVISNPPYVRTQLLGSELARTLARKFNLSGRVDLYHAFVMAMTQVLRFGGVLGLLTSNRFITTRAGASLRDHLLRGFRLAKLVDLGDTKLFEAAVLPAIIIAERGTRPGSAERCRFTRVYEKPGASEVGVRYESILDAVSRDHEGTAAIDNRHFKIEIGTLRAGTDQSVPWILSSRNTETWIETVSAHQSGTFADFGKVSVGIKSTADKVFIRDDWSTLPPDMRPEDELLRSLITHHIAERWTIKPGQKAKRTVLYPYSDIHGKKQVVDLADFPRAARYLSSHRERLEQRTYLVNSGRKWYEIWVPHCPADWMVPKIAFPDISSDNLFFLANSGWIVNGDCYWISLKSTAPQFYLHSMLAIANSSFIATYYDVMFHNKLYAGRRRFMSQYVEKFPVPQVDFARDIATMVANLLAVRANGDHAHEKKIAEEIDALVWESFGLTKEI